MPSVVAIGALLALGCLLARSDLPRRGSYVALGDSYTAGLFIPHPTVPGFCWRSDHAYPTLVASALHRPLSDASCASAVVQNLWIAQPLNPGSNPPQVDALSRSTAVVTVGIGANNMQFAALLANCLYPAPPAQPCGNATVPGSSTDLFSAWIRQSRPALVAGLGYIRSRAPEALVFVIGYPAALPARGSACGPGMELVPGNLPYARSKIIELNAALAWAARTAGVSYVDEYTASIGHDLCQPPGVRWIEPLVPAAPAAGLHPNAAGEAAMARLAVQAISAAGG